MYRPGLEAIGELGSGKKLSNAWPLLFMRAVGIMLPENCAAVKGSRTTGTAPLELIDFEKSPMRSKAVGTVTVTGSVGVIVCGFSIETKKKAFFRVKALLPSPNLSSGSGPLKLNPGILCRYIGFASFC